MNFWRENVNRILEMNDQKILRDNGNVSKEEMEKLVRELYVEFDQKRKLHDAKKEDLSEIEALEKELKAKRK